ncbi:MAG: murein biosynthesis integral membrane protein MurJ [Chloroflexi bacterium]|nr:murein biosynthesis integral membrane protein MurJ [Chloroflexota bacterium]
MAETSIDRLSEAADAVTQTETETRAGVAKATGILALGNVGSRVLGLAREIVLTNLFGASRAMDAFNYAIIVPKTLYDLLIAGHVNSAIIPVLSEVVTRDGQKALWQLVSILVSLVALIIAALVLLLEVFAPQVIIVVSGGSDPATQALAADVLRSVSPALIFLSLFAVLSGTLYALREFTLPALAGILFNASIVFGTLIFAPPLQAVLRSSGIGWLMTRPAEGIRAAAYGWLIGALVQFLRQLPGMRGVQFRINFNWRHPAVKQIALLYAPVMFSLVLDTFVRTFSYNLASQTGVGSVSYMNWATTLIQFPQGLVATAISIAILPTLARQSVLTEDLGFKNTLGLGLRLAITLILPATLGLFVLGTPIVRLLFEHGAFTAADTQITVHALRLYLIGLPFAAIDLLLVYAFYAQQDTLTPAVIGFGSLVWYMLVAVLLLPTFGLFSLMIADSAKHIMHALVSAFILWRRLKGFGDQRLFRTLLKTGAAALLMSAVALVIEPFGERMIGTSGAIREAVLVIAAGGVSGAVFLGAAFVLRIEELSWLWASVRRRLRS